MERRATADSGRGRVRRILWTLLTALAAVALTFASQLAGAPTSTAQPTAYVQKAPKNSANKPQKIKVTDWFHDPLGRMAFEYRLSQHIDDQPHRNVAVGFVDITGLKDVDTTGLRVVDAGAIKHSDPALYAKLGLAGRPEILRFAIIQRANNESVNDAKGLHSEMRLFLEDLNYMGVQDRSRVFVLYTDRKPCPGCGPEIPSSTDVYYAVRRGSNAAVTKLINTAKAQAHDEKEKAKQELQKQVAEDQALETQKAQEEKANLEYMAKEAQQLFHTSQPSGPCDEKALGATSQVQLAAFTRESAHAAQAAPCGGEDENSGSGSSPSSAGKTASGLAKALTQPVPTAQAPGGIDFSSLQLRYLSDPGDGSGLQYSFQASAPGGDDGGGTPTDGLKAARLTSGAFFTWLELDPSSFWVNLNPTEPDRIVDSGLGRTDTGRVMLQADLRMKKTVGRLIHPDTPLGREFWASISGNCMSFRTWIVPGTADVHQDGDKLYILKSPLNVEMETQYLKLHGEQAAVSCPQQSQAVQEHNQQLFRGLVLPRLEHEVNTSPAYAELRRVYLARIAAEWYRQLSTEQNTTYGSLIDQGDIDRWTTKTGWKPIDTFHQYVESYAKGEFRVTHKQVEGDYLYTRTYVYGGVDLTHVPLHEVGGGAGGSGNELATSVGRSLNAATGNAPGGVWLGSPTPKQLATGWRWGQPQRSDGFPLSDLKYPIAASLLLLALLFYWLAHRPSRTARRRPTSPVS